jgi:hypothetical protein
MLNGPILVEIIGNLLKAGHEDGSGGQKLNRREEKIRNPNIEILNKFEFSKSK